MGFFFVCSGVRERRASEEVAGEGGFQLLIGIRGGGNLRRRHGGEGRRRGDVCGDGGGGLNIFFGAEIPTKDMKCVCVCVCVSEFGVA